MSRIGVFDDVTCICIKLEPHSKVFSFVPTRLWHNVHCGFPMPVLVLNISTSTTSFSQNQKFQRESGDYLSTCE